MPIPVGVTVCVSHVSDCSFLDIYCIGYNTSVYPFPCWSSKSSEISTPAFIHFQTVRILCNRVQISSHPDIFPPEHIHYSFSITDHPSLHSPYGQCPFLQFVCIFLCTYYRSFPFLISFQWLLVAGTPLPVPLAGLIQILRHCLFALLQLLTIVLFVVMLHLLPKLYPLLWK